MNLFEVEKMSCCILVLKGIPIFVFRQYVIPVLKEKEDDENQEQDASQQEAEEMNKYGMIGFRLADAISPIPYHICAAKNKMKDGFSYMKSSFLQAPSDFEELADIALDYATLYNMFDFLVRYYVATYLHWLAWETYDMAADLSLERKIVRAFTLLREANDYRVAYLYAIEILNEVYDEAVYLREPASGKTIFYPVNKLVGFKVSNLLKRCGVKTLLYPYPLEPIQFQRLKAEGQADMFYPGTFVNVGTRGLKKLASKITDGEELAEITGRGDIHNVMPPNTGPNAPPSLSNTQNSVLNPISQNSG